LGDTETYTLQLLPEAILLLLPIVHYGFKVSLFSSFLYFLPSSKFGRELQAGFMHNAVKIFSSFSQAFEPDSA